MALPKIDGPRTMLEGVLKGRKVFPTDRSIVLEKFDELVAHYEQIYPNSSRRLDDFANTIANHHINGTIDLGVDSVKKTWKNVTGAPWSPEVAAGETLKQRIERENAEKAAKGHSFP